MKMKSRISIALLALLLSLASVSVGQGSSARRIEITASRFSYNPSEITLKKGEPVTLALTSTDVTHGLSIKELGVKVELKKGQTEEVPLTPDKTGVFQGKCSHFCGKGHGSMILAVNVVE
jgi:cytochrome c oxidase subunit 2